MISPVDSEGYRLIERTARQLFADAVTAPALVLGGTDARHYSALTPNVYRFMPVRFGPDDLTRVHGTNERISTEAYGEAVKFYIQLIRNSAQ